MIATTVQGNKVHPKKFNLWLMIIGIVMLFTGLTSAYIVRKGDGFWYNFQLPTVFLVSTVVVLLSSVSMIWAFRSAKNDELRKTELGLIATIILGITFCFTQYLGWMAMVDQGLYLITPKEGDKVSASFVYVISFLHLVHILGGLVFLFIVLRRTYNFKVHKKNTLAIDMCNTYWHFVGLLWVYLYLFLYFAPEF